MKTHRLYDSYISLRRRHGWNASSAYAYAKAMEEVAFQGLDFDGERWQGTHKGFDVAVSVEPDEWCDMDHYGTFSDKWEEGALENPHANWHCAESWRGRVERTQGNTRHFAYFIPQETEESLRRGMIRYYGKAKAATEARRITQEALARCLEPEVYVVSVQVRYKDVEVANWAVGGWEFGPYPEVDIWMECLPEAIEEARHNIDVIREMA